MCTLLPITKQNCPQGRAGIAKAWAAPCEDVDSLTFDADGSVTAITMQSGKFFVPIEFAKDVAFFNQEKSRVNNRGGNLNVAQTLSFNKDIMNATTRNQLKVLNGCCCLHMIVRDNTGRYHYAGITHMVDEVDSPASDTFVSEDMNTGDGSGNTGADPTSDNNEYVETITANVGFYAPFYIGTEAAIPVAP